MKYIQLLLICVAVSSVMSLGEKQTYLMSFNDGDCETFAQNYATLHNHSYKWLKNLKTMIVEFNEEDVLQLRSDENAQFYDACVANMEMDQEVTLEEPHDVEADPNADYFQWHLKRVSQRTLPLTDVFSRYEVVAESHVYVIDSGIDGQHTELKEHVSSVSKGFNSDICCGSDSMDPLCDCNKHGTHCAGLINSETAGYNLHTTLHAGKVFNWLGSASYAIILEAMEWAGETHTTMYSGTPGIVSMSLGGGYSAETNRAVKSLHDMGLTVVVAAGNSNKDACTGSPSSSEYAITVAASDITDGRAYFSEYGDCVDIFAPGQQIYSTVPDNSFEYLSGTSMATPIVAGIASYLATVEETTSPTEIKSVLQCIASADIISDAKTDSNLLAYHDYHDYTPSSCSYAAKKYPELMKLLKPENFVEGVW